MKNNSPILLPNQPPSSRGSQETHLYNSRIIDTYIQLVKHKYNHINVAELLNYADIKSYQLNDEGHWFTQQQINNFQTRLLELTNNPNIAREAGRYSASSETLGMLRLYILGLMGPTSAYNLVKEFAAKLTRSTVFEKKKISNTKIEITVTPHKGVHESPHQCDNRIGTFEAISTVFNYKIPQIEHPECIFKGGKCCRYIISWEETHHLFWRKITLLALFALPVIGCSLYPLVSATALKSYLIAAASSIAGLYFYANQLEKKELNSAINNLRGSSDYALEQANKNYNNALMINEIGNAMSMASDKETDLNGILKETALVLEKRLEFDQGIILLADSKQKKLTFRAGFGFDRTLRKQLEKTEFSLDNPQSRGMFVISYWNQKPFLINNLDDVVEDISPRSLEFAKSIGVNSFICCPIIYDGESLGVLAVHNTTNHTSLIQRDINLLMGIAPQIGITIHNIKTMEAKQRQFQSILQVLAASTDARDPITAGHSLKVTEYSIGICEELGLDHEYTEMVRVAALLHDYGKIGVNDSSLKKPGRLSDSEYAEIKTHASKTREILEQINFEGIYEQVPEIAGSHHEKLDGTGYPQGLKDDQIHLGSKILAVADVYEAITSKRHYRDPMPRKQASKVLTDGIGTHFAGNCVTALFNWLDKQPNTPE